VSSATTYDISSILRALGSRSRQVPSLDAGALIPVVVMGDFSLTLASEVVEARGVVPGDFLTQAAGSWCGFYVQSLSPGGLVVEYHDHLVTSAIWFRSDEVPWAGGSFTKAIFPTGGGSIQSRYNAISVEPDPPPNIPLLDGGATWSSAQTSLAGPLVRWWVPAGSFFGLYNPSVNMLVPNIRFREIPEAQGPP